MGAASSPRLDLPQSGIAQNHQMPTRASSSSCFFVDFKEAERNTGPILENSSDTLWVGMLLEAARQNEAGGEVTRLGFSLCSDMTWGEGPPRLWAVGPLMCVYTDGSCPVASAVVGFSWCSTF